MNDFSTISTAQGSNNILDYCFSIVQIDIFAHDMALPSSHYYDHKFWMSDYKSNYHQPKHDYCLVGVGGILLGRLVVNLRRRANRNCTTKPSQLNPIIAFSIEKMFSEISSHEGMLLVFGHFISTFNSNVNFVKMMVFFQNIKKFSLCISWIKKENLIVFSDNFS